MQLLVVQSALSKMDTFGSSTKRNVHLIEIQNKGSKKRWGQLQEYAPFTWQNQKFRMENQIIHAIPIGKLQKIWDVIYVDAIFLFFSVCLVDLDIVCSWLFSHSIKCSSFIFMQNISTWLVCVNGKHPRCPFYRGLFLIEVFVKRQSGVSYSGFITVKPCLTATSVIQSPRHYGNFFLAAWQEPPYIFI